jgi:serine/threonine protein kinase/Flp pilus assembly protein TadD
MSEESIFTAALAKGDPAERAAFLDGACGGDADLRRRVEELLRVHGDAGPFLERPAAAPRGTAEYQPDGDSPPREGPGTVIGPYKLLQQIGEGGMGAVYMAEQERPVRRRVALKVIKPGMDSKQVIARFEAERQALALMDHLHIAKVLDAGTTAEGRPFFVMELVRGVPITKFCDQEHLTPRERLELFVPVCQAVQHAHQKGVIHRDLKPSNILVTLYDGKPVPKVIDFGVAKALHTKLTDRTMFTEFGAVVGTLEYMSPEQAELSGLDVDTRSDIYSLGVLLYELLTGTTPFDRKRLRQAALAEVLRIIHEEEPPKPSTRLSQSGESLAGIAAARKTEPARLTKLVRGELDWIVMKALEKDRARRYDTANGLARDLQRYLADEPVEACPPGAGYRLRKFARRYRAALATAAAFAGLLVLAAGVSAWQAWRARQAEAQARAERDAAQAARERADQNFALAKDAVDKYLSKVTDNVKLSQDDFHQLRKELLETALPFYQKFADQEGQDPELRAARGQAYHRLAVLRDDMGDRATALADYRRALEILEPLVVEFPAVAPYRKALADSQVKYGYLLGEMGRPVEAETQLRKALTISEQLVTEFPTVPEYRVDLAECRTDLGILLGRLGRAPETEVQYRKALALREKLAADFPTVAVYQRNVAGALHNLAMAFLGDTRRTREAVALYEQAIHYQGRALELDPRDARARNFLGYHHANLANLLLQLGRRDEAVDHFRQGLDAMNKLATAFPSVPRYRSELGAIHNDLGGLLHTLGRWDEATAQYRQARDICDKLAAEFPTVASHQRDVAGALHNLAMILERTGQRTEALALFERALRQQRQVLEREPQNDLARVYLQEHHLRLGQLLASLGRRTEADAQLRQAVAVGEKPLPDPEGERQRPHLLALSRSRLGRLLAELGRWDDAETQCRQALAVQDKLVTESPDVHDNIVDRAESYATLGSLVRDRGRPHEALDWYAKAVAALEPLLAKEQRLWVARDALREACAGRARALDRLHRHAEAAQDWERALEFDDGQHRPVLRLGRAIAQAHASGDHGKALVEADSLAKDSDGPTLEALARLCALASAAGGEPYAARAVGLLRQALSKGYCDTAYLKDGADLAPLRSRKDFQTLLAEAAAPGDTRSP